MRWNSSQLESAKAAAVFDQLALALKDVQKAVANMADGLELAKHWIRLRDKEIDRLKQQVSELETANKNLEDDFFKFVEEVTEHREDLLLGYKTAMSGLLRMTPKPLRFQFKKSNFSDTE